MGDELTTDILLLAYRAGIFPMADSDNGGAIYWYRPDPRAILPVEDFRISRSLARAVRKGVFEVTTDHAFQDVIHACRERARTWISDEIERAYVQLHHDGHAHSVETWYDGELVGGLYGVSIGGAFFGESMFHRRTDASKVALVWVAEHLRARGFELHDVQFRTPHLEQFGVVEVSAAEYSRRLRRAVAMDDRW